MLFEPGSSVRRRANVTLVIVVAFGLGHTICRRAAASPQGPLWQDKTGTGHHNGRCSLDPKSFGSGLLPPGRRGGGGGGCTGSVTIVDRILILERKTPKLWLY